MLIGILLLETGPSLDKKTIDYHSDSHIPPYLPVSDLSSRDNDTISTSIHHSFSESGLSEALIGAASETETRDAVIGDRSPCVQ